MPMTRNEALAFMDLNEGASPEEIKKRYYKLAVQFHPDKKGGSKEKFQALGNAFEELSTTKPSASSRATQPEYKNATYNNIDSMMQKSVETTFKARSAFKASLFIIDLAARTLELHHNDEASSIQEITRKAEGTYMQAGENARIDAVQLLTQAAEKLTTLSVGSNTPETAILVKIAETATTASRAAVQAADAEKRAMQATVLKGTYAFCVVEDALLDATDCADMAAEAKKAAILAAPDAANPKPTDPFAEMKARHANRRQQASITSNSLNEADSKNTPSAPSTTKTNTSHIFNALRSAYHTVRSKLSSDDNTHDDKKPKL